MIIPEKRFGLSGLPDVWFYPDDRTPSGFYAIPAHPSVAVDDQGQPQISLVLYGSRQGVDFEARGGIFTVTVCLGLSAAQAKTATSLLAHRLTQAGTAGRAQLLSPDWQQGTVELELGQDLVWQEKSSLVGDNRCAFNVKLSAEQVKTLTAAWKKGLPNSSVTYHVVLRSSSGKSSQSASGSSTTTQRDGAHVRQEQSSWQRSTSSASTPYAMEIRGPLGLSQAELDAKLNVIPLK
jgi:hypothetical protein